MISFNGTFVVICFHLIIKLIKENSVDNYLHLLSITDLLFLGERHVVWRWFWQGVSQLYLLLGWLSKINKNLANVVHYLMLCGSFRSSLKLAI